jgi:hypothetical protein
MGHRERHPGVEWGVFQQMKGGRVVMVDVAPCARTGRMSNRHVSGLGCECKPRMDETNNGVPIIIHDHKMTTEVRHAVN